jgi:hypothetical protein
VDNGGNLLLRQQLIQGWAIADIPLHKPQMGMAVQIRQVIAIAGIGQGIEHHHPIGGIVLNPMVDKIGADKTSPASD